MPVKKLLQDKERKFRLLFEENPQPMWVFDPQNQKFLQVNAAAAGLHGYSQEEFRGMALPDVQVPVEDGDPHTAPGVRHHRTKSGRIIDVETAVHTIQYGGQDAELAVLIDVTGRRQLEDRLRQAQKMEAVGMLAGGVAHDFNNLLTIITGYSQLILNHLPPSDPNRYSAEQIMKAGTRAAELTRQLLAFSRRQVLQPKVVDLNILVTSLSAMLRRLIGEDVDLHVALGPDPVCVHADPSQLEQVIMNLVINARDAMPHGGTLTVETRNAELNGSYSGGQMEVKPGPYVMLAVRDNGIGMDSATKARIFEPFFTTKGEGKGTGLGLSTVYAVVRQSGGGLQVSSELGRGTSVKVFLPRIDRPVLLESVEHRQAAAHATEAILVVEDDDMVRHLVRETLEREGYKIMDAAGPVEARRLMEQYAGPFHLLITDVVMPKVNGRQLAGQLLRKRPDLKVLYMSGYADADILKTGLMRRKVSFLQKPFTPRALSEKVREVLHGDRLTRGAG